MRMYSLLHRKGQFCAVFLIAAFASIEAPGQPQTVTFLHTNDMHAGFVPHEAIWARTTPKPLVGGFEELAFKVDSIRSLRPLSILVDCGDVMTGNPICDIEYRGASGGALYEMMNRIGYDVSCPGNHDFDISQENLVRLTTIATFPSLSANLVNAQGRFPVNNKPYAIIERGGLKIGFIGLMSQELYGLVNQNSLVGIKVLSPVETAKKYIAELRSKTDLLVAITHQGFSDDSVLAQEAPGLDIVIGGHSHTRLKAPRVVNDVRIVQTGANCENLGLLDVTVDEGKVVSATGSLIQLWPGKDRPPSKVSPLVDSMEAIIDREYSEVIGTLTEDWVRKQGGSAIGTFITEAQREAAHAEIGFMNDHGIRKDLSAGEITKRELFEVLPFRNVLMTFQLSGEELETVARYYLERRPAIQMTGMIITWRPTGDGGKELVDITVQGKPLEKKRMYICAASDFLVGEAERYMGIEILKPISLQQTVFGAVESAIRREKQITPKQTLFLEQAQ
jgi:2',3'-cyclic-nucleotide 2'-phosphodiesterase (5'-nucleotidase family)